MPYLGSGLHGGDRLDLGGRLRLHSLQLNLVRLDPATSAAAAAVMPQAEQSSIMPAIRHWKTKAGPLQDGLPVKSVTSHTLLSVPNCRRLNAITTSTTTHSPTKTSGLITESSGPLNMPESLPCPSPFSCAPCLASFPLKPLQKNSSLQVSAASPCPVPRPSSPIPAGLTWATSGMHSWTHGRAPSPSSALPPPSPSRVPPPTPSARRAPRNYPCDKLLRPAVFP